VRVSGLNGANAIAVGGSQACAIVSGGRVECWGSNGDGELGIGTSKWPDNCITPCSTSPVVVSGIRGAVAIAAGPGSTCAELPAGKLDCSGSLGGVTQSYKLGPSPAPVGGLAVATPSS
jgi:Regulator of chromosome condensation (RCC1) repeat